MVAKIGSFKNNYHDKDLFFSSFLSFCYIYPYHKDVIYVVEH